MRSGNRIVSDIPLIWSDYIIKIPDWLAPYLEREFADKWQFYKRGADFTEEQYKELQKFTYYRTPDIDYNFHFIGVTIKLFKRISLNNILP